MSIQNKNDSRVSDVARRHGVARAPAAWIPEFSGTSLRFCNPTDPTDCTAFVDLQGVNGVITNDAPLSITGTAGEAVGAFVPVYESPGGMRPADATDVSTRQVIGLTTNGALATESLTAVTVGPVVNGGWNWVVGAPVYVADGGGLSQTPGTYEYSVGVAIASDEVLVDLESRLRAADEPSVYVSQADPSGDRISSDPFMWIEVDVDNCPVTMWVGDNTA